MAVSKSTIVFALVTCVPFGFAIKDLAGEKSGKHGHVDRGDDSYDDHDDDGDYEAAMARAEVSRREAEAAREAAEAKATRDLDARKRKLRTVYGAEPATLGPALGGVALGSVSALAATQVRLRALDTGAELEAIGDTALHGLAIRLTDTHDGAGCSELESDLQQVWGDGEVGIRGHYWINPALSQRAAFKAEDTICELRIERYVAPAAWIDGSKTAVVPVWAVGRPSKELLDHLAARGSVQELDRGTDDELSWVDTGAGPNGTGPTRFTASLGGGRIVAVVAHVNLELEASEAVVAHMVKVFGAYTDDGTMVWKRAKPQLEAEIAGPQLYVTAGKQPE